MIYKELRDHVLDIAGEESGEDFEDMIKVTMNLLYFELLEEVQMDLEVREFTLTTAANKSKYGLPLYVRRILNIDDATATKRLEPISSSQFDREYAGTTATGNPDYYYPFGTLGVQRQPPIASTLKVVSSSTNDAGSNYLVYARGMVSGVWTREEMELNGTSTVTSSNTFDADGMQRIILRTDSAKTILGNITVKDADDTDAVSAAGATTTVFRGSSSLSSTDDIYNGKTVTFTSGDASGETQTITDYDGGDKEFTIGTALSAAPASADGFTVNGLTLAEIPPYYGSSPDYQWVEFQPIPSDKRDLTIRSEMAKSPLVNDEDWPELPVEYHDLLIWGTAAALLPAKGNIQAADRYQQRFNKRIRRLLTGQQKRRGRMRTFGNVTNIFLAGGPRGPNLPRNTATSADLI